MSRRARYIVGCSFGKDSLATVITAVEHGEPLDEAVYCEVMFDEHISGEVPEHRDFIYGVGIPTLKSMGIKTTIIRGKRTYVSSFTRVIEKGPHAGQINAFPLCGRCCIQRDCKIRPIEKWVRSLEGDVVQYIGLAADEQERLMKKGIQNHVSIGGRTYPQFKKSRFPRRAPTDTGEERASRRVPRTRFSTYSEGKRPRICEKRACGNLHG